MLNMMQSWLVLPTGVTLITEGLAELTLQTCLGTMGELALGVRGRAAPIPSQLKYSGEKPHTLQEVLVSRLRICVGELAFCECECECECGITKDREMTSSHSAPNHLGQVE